MGMMTPAVPLPPAGSWRGDSRIIWGRRCGMNEGLFLKASPRDGFLIFSCMWGTSKHSSSIVTSECFKSVYFSSLCEINKFPSLETRESDLQRRAQKLAAADAAGNGSKLLLSP